MCGADLAGLGKRERPRVVVRDKPSHPNCGKACSYSGSHVEVNRAHWDASSDAAKAFTMAHEMAHAHGTKCEACADLIAGDTMRAWGFSSLAAKSGALQAVKSRPMAGEDAAAGWFQRNRYTGKPL